MLYSASHFNKMQYYLKLFVMKKIIGLLFLSIAIATMSCGDETKETKKEVVVVPAAAPKKEVIVVPSTPAPEKGTSVSMDKNGVKVEVKK